MLVNKMKYDLVSDMHVEMNNLWKNDPTYDGISSIYPWHHFRKSEVLVVAGDCSNDPRVTATVIEEAREFYPHVIFTDGNHEHYIGYRDPEQTVGHNMGFFREFADERPSVTYLDGEKTVTIDRTLFIGANGWYDWTAHSFLSRDRQHNLWKLESNDSRCIRFSPDGYPDKMARRQAEQLRILVEQAQDNPDIDQIAVVTHTIPHRSGVIPDTHPWGHLNGSYHNAVMGQVWIADKAKKIVSWVFGHTHYHHDFVAEGIRFVNNARGYYAHSPKAESKFLGPIQIDTEESLKSAFEIE